MCHNIFDLAAGKMDCPIRITPKCHPKSPIDVYVSVKTRTIMLCCSRCDRPISFIRPGNDNERPKKNAGKGK